MYCVKGKEKFNKEYLIEKKTFKNNGKCKALHAVKQVTTYHVINQPQSYNDLKIMSQ